VKIGGSGGTGHQLVWQGTCQTGTFRYRLKSKKGSSEAVSTCRSFQGYLVSELSTVSPAL
jgi:hypothetical protein